MAGKHASRPFARVLQQYAGTVRVRFVHALAAYLLLAAWLTTQVPWHLAGADSFQYVRLAERYADGSFGHVVNGYWSPLIIWLLVLPVKALPDGIVAFKALQLLIGAATLYAWHRLLRIAWPGAGHGLLLLAAVPLLLAHALLMLTPDLLFVTIALIALCMAVKGDALRSPRHAVAFGLVGALWYFAKHFGLPLFIAFLLVLLCVGMRTRPLPRRKLLLHGAIALGTCLLVSAPWMLALGMEYGHPTISEAARYNLTVEVAPMPGQYISLPVIADGLHAMPPGAVSPWETPGDIVELTPLRPWTDPQRYLSLVERNLLSAYYHDVRRQFGALFLLVLLAAVLVRGLRTIMADRGILLPLLLMACLNAGYALTLMHGRYLWLNTFLMMLALAKLLPLLFPRWPVPQRALLCAALLLAVKRPVKEILYGEDRDVSARTLAASLLRPRATMSRTYEAERVAGRVVDELRERGVRGPFASLQDNGHHRDGYSQTLRIAYGLGAAYHGAVPSAWPIEEQLRQIEEHGIRCFVVWDGMEWHHGTLIIDEAPPGPRIYELAPSPPEGP